MVSFILVGVVVMTALGSVTGQSGNCLSTKSCNGHGTCRTTAGCTSYSCDCTGNYTGSFCSIPPDCTANGRQCGDHGDCNTQLKCDCKDKYYGRYCQIPPICTDTGNECGAYGECNTCGSITNACQCNSGYGGKTCKIAPVCTIGGNECKNGGQCDFTQSPYNCTCLPEYDALGDTCGAQHVTFTTLFILPLLGGIMTPQQ